MKGLSWLFLWAGLCLVPSLRADQIELVSGEILSGKVKRLEGENIRFEMSIGGGVAEAPYKLSLIKKIIFQRSPEEDALVKSVNPADIPALLKLLEQRKPLFTMQGSDAGEIVLRIVKLELIEGTKTSAKDALLFLELVEKQDWSATRKAQVPGLRISALLKSGQTEKAAAELDKLETTSGSDENAVAEAQIQGAFLKAQKAAQDLQELEKEFPRWDLMPEKRSERNRLIQAVLDNYLYAAVFRADFPAMAAQGLYQAALMNVKIKDTEQARAELDEILKEFPEPEYVAQARDLLKKMDKDSGTKETPQKK